MVSLTVMGRPFHSLVFFWMSSPIFLGERPRGPSLGARAAVFPTSPPIARRITYCASPGPDRGRTYYQVYDKALGQTSSVAEVVQTMERYSCIGFVRGNEVT